MHQHISDEQWRRLLLTRATRPDAVAEAYARRERPHGLLSERGTMFLVAADHTARGALAVGPNPMAMADRRSLLDRLITALAHPDVDGVLGSPDIIEELLLLGALEGKVVIGSMNRGGLDGATWTMDDRFTGYDAAGIEACRLEGGKMLLRIDDGDAGTVPTIQACAQAVTQLARRRLLAMVEPLPYHRDADGRPGTAQGRRRAGPSRDDRLRARQQQRLHLAEAAVVRRSRDRLRRDHAALRDPRRGARPGSRGGAGFVEPDPA